MPLFKKERKQIKKTSAHNELIQKILNKVKALKVRYEDNLEIVDILNEIYATVSNFTPLAEREEKGVDKKILNLLEDVEIMQSKAEKRDDYDAVKSTLRRVRELMASR